MPLIDLLTKAKPMDRYVSTVILSEDLAKIVTIYKKHPTTIAGKINAIGGRIEPGEALFVAAVREINVYTGLIIDKRALDLIGNLSAVDYSWDIACFVVILNEAELMKAKTLTDEPVQVWNVGQLLMDPNVDLDFKHMIYEALRLKSKQTLYDGSRGIAFTSN